MCPNDITEQNIEKCYREEIFFSTQVAIGLNNEPHEVLYNMLIEFNIKIR